jgi:hypothetical protein
MIQMTNTLPVYSNFLILIYCVYMERNLRSALQKSVSTLFTEEKGVSIETPKLNPTLSLF